MYYNAGEFERAIKCSFCKEKSDEMVKLVPECGCFICGKCYAAIQVTAAANAGKYKCESCKETHSMPKDGLADCKQLLPLLRSPPLHKPLSENGKRLKTLVKVLVDKVEKLEAFDARKVANEYCDQLELDVKKAAASASDHLRKVEMELLAEINEYRTRCLNEADDRAKKEVNTLSTETKQLHAEWNRYFTRIEVFEKEAHIKASLDQIDGYMKKFRKLEIELKNEALNGESMIFKPNLAFFEKSDYLGKLESLVQQKIRIPPAPMRTLAGHSSRIFAVLHLPSDRLASSSEDKTIRIWNVKEETELFKLEGHTGPVYSLALLPNGHLVSGSGDTTIKIWDLEQKKAIRTLRRHASSVLSLCVLENGNLASCSSDDTIKVWSPNLSENNLLLTIAGHGNLGWIASVNVLSNGSLVTCSRDLTDTQEAILRVWNPNDGKLIKEVASGVKAARSFVLLRGDRAAIGFVDGSISTVHLRDSAVSATRKQAHDSLVYALAQLANGNLISCGQDKSKPTIKVWTMPDFGLVQTIGRLHTQYVISLYISPYETKLASADQQNNIDLWPITNLPIRILRIIQNIKKNSKADIQEIHS